MNKETNPHNTTIYSGSAIHLRLLMETSPVFVH